MDFFIEIAARTIAGAIALYFSMHIVREPLPFHDALWLAALPIVLLIPAALALGFLLHDNMAVRLLLAASFTLWFESLLLRVNARRHEVPLRLGKAYLASFAYVAGSMLIAPQLSLVFDKLH